LSKIVINLWDGPESSRYVCGPKFMVAIINDRNANPCPLPVKRRVTIFHNFFTLGFTKFKPVALKMKIFLTSQNLTKNRLLLVVCNKIQEYKVVKTHLGN